MLDTSALLGVANDPGDQGLFAAAGAPEQDFRFPGPMAGVIWAVGLVIGLTAFLTGYTWVGVVALGAAVLAPWFGLAWVSHGQRGAYNVELPSHD